MSNITIENLEKLIIERAKASPDESYTSSLLSVGIERVARKVGEEAIETVIASLTGDDKEVSEEAADLIFHLLVLLRKRNIDFDKILDVLQKRTGYSGLTEKASRN